MKLAQAHSITAIILVMAIQVPVLADSEEGLAKKSQNPVGDIISLPFEHNLAFGVILIPTLCVGMHIKP